RGGGDLVGTQFVSSQHRGLEPCHLVTDVAVFDEHPVDLLADARPQWPVAVLVAPVFDEVDAARQPAQAAGARTSDVAVVETEPDDLFGTQDFVHAPKLQQIATKHNRLCRDCGYLLWIAACRPLPPVCHFAGADRTLEPIRHPQRRNTPQEHEEMSPAVLDAWVAAGEA